jgi:catechol 2,3-dioxygenase-like lactoylglutathione lyase family enzyme
MAGTRFHISLNASSLDRSVAFYQTLLGAPPAKRRLDYAKFEVDDPPIVLSLEPKTPGKEGQLNHVGFRVPNATVLAAMHARLGGLAQTSKCESLECCYSRQTKFWTYDPDGVLWEVYTLDADLDHRGDAVSTQGYVKPEPVRDQAALAVWEHRMREPLPERAPFGDASLDEVRLRGTFNLAIDRARQEQVIAEARRVLKPGGRIYFHVLTAERPFAGHPDLPGPSSVVEHVPVDSDVVQLAEAAGFERVRLLQLDAKPCYTRQGIDMRETQIEAWKPSQPSGRTVTVVYKGPFRELRDDRGNVFPRGRRVTADAALAERLRAPEMAAHFLVLDPPAAGPAS